MLAQTPEVVVNCAIALLPALREVYDSFVNPSVRKKWYVLRISGVSVKC